MLGKRVSRAARRDLRRLVFEVNACLGRGKLSWAALAGPKNDLAFVSVEILDFHTRILNSVLLSGMSGSNRSLLPRITQAGD